MKSFFMRVTILIFTGFACLNGTAQNQTIRYGEQAERGKKTLNENEYENALELFNEALEQSYRENNSSKQADFHFYLGLTRQKQAVNVDNSETKYQLLNLAKEDYQTMLEINPNSSTALYNLSQVYLQTGNEDLAIEYMKRAIDLEDRNQIFYMLNLAHAYEDDNIHEAIEWYNKIIEISPTNKEAHNRLTDLYFSGNLNLIFPYLWKLIDLNEIKQTQDIIYRLVDEKEFVRTNGDELLSVIAVGLSKQNIDPGSFLDSPINNRMNNILEFPSYKDGIQQLRLLFSKSNLNPDGYLWWGNKTNIRKEPKRGVWPAEGFRMLSRSIGDWYRAKGKLNDAKQYYLLAARLVEREPDPIAFLQLADLYMEYENGVEQIENMIQEFAPAIFVAKGFAYKNSQLKKIVKFHKSLGIIYASVGKWGNSHTPQSAIFQLEHAITISEKINDRRKEGEEIVYPEPRYINLLAKAYQIKNKGLDAYRIRVEAADVYLQMNNKTSAGGILKPIEKTNPPAQISTSTKRKYERLKLRLESNEQ